MRPYLIPRAEMAGLQMTTDALADPRAGQSKGIQGIHHSLVDLPPELNLRLVFTDGNDRVDGPAASELTLAGQAVGSLQSAHVRPLLAEPLGPVLAVAHAHDVARADQIGDVGLEGRALAEGARAEPRHGPREPRHVAVHDVGPGEVGDGSRQQLLHEQIDDVLVAEPVQGRRVVEVTRQYRALRRFPSPQRIFVGLQLVQHEERPAGPSKPLKPRQHVRRSFCCNVPVEPNPAGHDIDAIQCSCGRKIRAAFAEDGGVRHDALQPFDPEGEHTGVDFEKLLLPRAVGVPQGRHFAAVL
mmetsp:Transcript_13123/g.24071  ORF Transcript_13123/g.24071 Transcript_13123/m.24071 type:complete len:299 (-) Transcript_13123:1363-2259(-)